MKENNIDFSGIINEFKSKINRISTKIDKGHDIKLIKNELISLNDEIRMANLPYESRQLLKEMSSFVFDKLKEIQNKLNDTYERESVANYINLKKLFDTELIKLKMIQNLQDRKDQLIELQAKMRDIKLTRAHKDELHERLQIEFTNINNLREMEKEMLNRSSNENYQTFKTKVDQAINLAEKAEYYDEARSILIGIQSELKMVKLTKNHKDELFIKIQNCFDKAKKIKEEAMQKTEFVSKKNYEILLPIVEKALDFNLNEKNLKEIKNQLIEVQKRVKAETLHRDQRNELWEKLDKGFKKIKEFTDSHSTNSEDEQKLNYVILKKRVEEGFRQANTTNEFKKTRNYLKNVQDEFRMLRMKKEEREELYSRLQLAFSILNSRVDEYFRERKKFWDTKMQYKITGYENDIYEVEKQISELNEQIDELEIQRNAARNEDDLEAIKEYSAKIEEIKINIENFETQIADIQSAIDELNNKLNPSEEAINSEELNENDENL